jgi:hypothetical protein
MTTEINMVGQVIETTKATFGAVDTYNDGLLEEHKYLTYLEMILQNYKAAYSVSIAYDADNAKAKYAFVN